MKTATKQPSDPHVLAVLHQTGRVYRAIIARLASNGRAGTATLLSYREFAEDELSQVGPWLEEHQVGEVIGVLPASSVICRTCTLPNAGEDQLLPALRLQAESHLLGIAPPHRVGMSVIEAAPDETGRIGLVLAWPNQHGGKQVEPPATDEDGRPISRLMPIGREVAFAPDIAGLAALLNGHRPIQPLLWMDRADGSCAVALTHANGAVFRGLREEEHDADAWKQRIGQALAETAINVGHSASFIEEMVQLTQERMDTIEPRQAKLFVPDQIIDGTLARLEQAPTDKDWWSQYGIAVGIVLARSGKLAELTKLREYEPREKPSAIRAAVDFLSHSNTARVAVLACVLVLLFGPWLISGVRLGILKMQHNRVADQLESIEQTENKLVVYRHLSSNTWPMTKILADITSCTPEGIELENIHVRQQQTFTLSGRAIPTNDRTAPQVVELMREQLRATGIFNDITLNWGEGDAYGNYEFGLNARLHRPFLRVEYPEEQDFARWTLADRRDGFFPDAGDDVSGPLASGGGWSAPREHGPNRSSEPEAAPDGPDTPDASDNRRQSAPAPVGPGTRVGGPGSPRDRGSGGVRPSEDIPPPLSEEEIRRMSQSEVSDMLVKISAARRIARRGDDQELIDRLQREFDLLMTRMREAAD